MPKHLTATECDRIDRLVRAQKRTATAAWRAINQVQQRRQVKPVTPGAVYRYVRDTHKRAGGETRGRPCILTKRQIRAADLARQRLVRQARNEYRVTCDIVLAEANLEGVGCKRAICDRLRSELCVGYRPARKKIGLVEADSKTRLAFATVCARRPTRCWNSSRRISV